MINLLIAISIFMFGGLFGIALTCAVVVGKESENR